MGTSFGRAEQWARPRVTLIRDVPVASFRSSPSPPPPEVTTSGAVRHQLAGFDEAHCHTDSREGRSRSRLSESARPRQAPSTERTVRKEPSGWIALKDPISIPLAQASLEEL